MTTINRLMLSGTTPLTLLLLGAASAYAGAGDAQIEVNTTYSDGGGINGQGLSYAYTPATGTGTLTISGAITAATPGNEAMNIYGNGNGIPTLQVTVTGSLTGAEGARSENGMAGSGLVIDDTVSMAGRHITLTNTGTIRGAAGTTSHAAGVGIDAYSDAIIVIDNAGTIRGGDEDPSSPLSRRALGFDQAGAAVTLNNRSGGTIIGDLWASSHGDQYNFYGGTLTGTILGQATSGGTLQGTGADVLFRSGTTTVSGDIGQAFGSVSGFGHTAYVGPVRSLTVENGATLKFGQDSNIHAGVLNVVNGGTFDLGTHRISNHYYDSINAQEIHTGNIYFKTTINASERKHGYFVFTGVGSNDTDFFESGTPTLIPVVVGTVTAGDDYIIIKDTNGRVAENLPAVVNSGGYRWTVSSVTGSGQSDTHDISYGTGETNIIITADRLNAAGSAGGPNGSGVRALAMYSGSDPALQALSQAVNTLTSDSDIRKAGAQLRPEAASTTAQASMGAVTQALGTIQTRTDAVRIAASETGTGISSGETLAGLGVWGQAFGSTAQQTERRGLSGYDADTYGLAFGADTKVAEALRLGLSFAYARTDVDATGDRSGSGQDISSSLTSLYGTYSGRGWYVDGALTYGIHQYDSSRLVSIAGVAAQTLKASHDGHQIGATTEVGVPTTVGPAVVTPLASLAYSTLRQDSYSETGGAAALRVSASTTDSIRSGLGAKVAAKMAALGSWDITPTARALWTHEFNTAAQDQTSAFVAGGASFTTPGTDIAADHLILGIGLDVASLRGTTVSVKYDADLADRYISHSGSLQLRTEF